MSNTFTDNTDYPMVTVHHVPGSSIHTPFGGDSTVPGLYAVVENRDALHGRAVAYCTNKDDAERIKILLAYTNDLVPIPPVEEG